MLRRFGDGNCKVSTNERKWSWKNLMGGFLFQKLQRTKVTAHPIIWWCVLCPFVWPWTLYINNITTDLANVCTRKEIGRIEEGCVTKSNWSEGSQAICGKLVHFLNNITQVVIWYYYKCIWGTTGNKILRKRTTPYVHSHTIFFKMWVLLWNIECISLAIVWHLSSLRKYTLDWHHPSSAGIKGGTY